MIVLRDYIIETFVFLDSKRGWKLVSTEHILAKNSEDALRFISSKYTDLQYIHEVKMKLPIFENIHNY